MTSVTSVVLKVLISAVDVLVLSVIINLMGQLKIVQKAIRTIDDHLEEVEEGRRDFLKELKLAKCVSEIQRLLR